MRYTLFLLAAVFAAITMSGCAFGTDYVKLNKYSASSPAEKPGSGVEVYLAKAEDNRSQPEYVGQKAGGYIALEKGIDLSKVVTSSVSDCLDSYGYVVKGAEGAPAGARVLNVSVDELWTTFVAGFWTVDGNAKIKISFELVEKDTNRVLWKKKIGKGAIDSGMAATPSLFEDSLNDALKAAMQEFETVISTPEFKNAVSRPAEAKN